MITKIKHVYTDVGDEAKAVIQDHNQAILMKQVNDMETIETLLGRKGRFVGDMVHISIKDLAHCINTRANVTERDKNTENAPESDEMLPSGKDEKARAIMTNERGKIVFENGSEVFLEAEDWDWLMQKLDEAPQDNPRLRKLLISKTILDEDNG